MFNKKSKSTEERQLSQDDKQSAGPIQPEEAPLEQVDVYTLPKKFLPNINSDSTHKKNNKVMFILLGVLVLIVAIGLGAWFYFNNKNLQDAPSTPTAKIAPLDESENNEEEVSNQENENTVLPDLIIYVAKDYHDNELGTLTLQLSGEDAEIVDQVEISNTKSVSDNPKVIGAIYRIIPSGYSLKGKATLTISYFDADMSSSLENSLRIGYEESNGEWRPVENSILDLNKNEVSLDIMQIPRTRVAIVSNLSQLDLNNSPDNDSNTESVNYEVKILKTSLDTDEDKLTDVEEIMYGTALDKPDTDGDGYIDGEEILNYYSPLVAGQKLSESGLFSEYKNDKFSYKVIYPKSWSPSSASEDSSVIIFNSPTSQFIEIVVEEKDPEINNIVDWYAKQLPGLDRDELRHTIVGQDDREGIYSLDGSVVYFIYNDWVVAVSYNLGISQEADYLTTWQAVINSWQPLLTENLEEKPEEGSATSTTGVE